MPSARPNSPRLPRWIAAGALLLVLSATTGAPEQVAARRSYEASHRTIALVRWAPDGRRVAFLARESRADVLYVAPAAGEVTERRALRVVAAELVHSPFAWSPDARLLAGTSPRGVAIVDTRERRLRARIVAGGTFADWSPTSGRVVFWRPPRGDAVTYDVRPDGRGARRLVAGSDADVSPDGRSLAFAAHGRIHVLRSGVAGPVQVSPDERTLAGGTVRRNAQYRPVWSPDGRRIAYRERTWSAIPETDDETYVVVADGSRASVRVGDGVAHWSPTSRHVAIDATWTPGVRVAAADGSASAVLANAYAGMDWSPDGKRATFSDGDDVYVTNLSGSRRRRVTAGRWPRWSPRGGVLAVVRATRCGDRVFTVRLRDGAVRPLTHC